MFKGIVLVNKNIIEVVKKGIDMYNRYRGREAHSSLVSIESDVIRIRFEGHFCRTCGVYDWIDDFRYVLEDLGLETDLEEVVEPNNDEDWRIGVFRIKNISIDKGVGENE